MTIIYELSIFLEDISPLIWRRFRIPASANLEDLHRVIQVVMGWDNVHDHGFMTGGMRFALPRRAGERSGHAIGNESGCSVGDVLVKPKQRMIYIYNRGAGWRHTITLASIHASLSLVPRCVDGARACPPDDCGGCAEYARFLAMLADPAAGRAETLRAWFAYRQSEGFDPDEFQSHCVNRRLAKGWMPWPAQVP